MNHRTCVAAMPKASVWLLALASCLLPSLALGQATTAPPSSAGAVNPATLRQRAIDILVTAAMGDDPALRSNAIEAMMNVPERALPVTQKALGDKNPGVRFAAVVAATMQDMRNLAPAIEPLLNDPEPSVRAAALYALRQLGRNVDITPLAQMLQSEDPRLRANVALLLGMMGEKSAAPMLRRAAATQMSPRVTTAQEAVVRIQIAEAIAKLGADDALDALRAGAFSQFDEVRVISVTAMGAVKDRRMTVMLEQILRDPPVELQLAAAGALARMGNTSGRQLAQKHAASENPILRAQAAWVLGWFDDNASLPTLAQLLEDPQQIVRVAAAAAVVRRANPAGRG